MKACGDPLTPVHIMLDTTGEQQQQTCKGTAVVEAFWSQSARGLAYVRVNHQCLACW